jgi:uncharacterized protein
MSAVEWPTAAATAFALAGPPALVVVSRRLFGDAPPLGVQIALQLLFCGFAAAIVAFVVMGEQLPLSSIGVRRVTAATIASGLLVSAAALYVLPVLTRPLAAALRVGDLDARTAGLSALPGWFRVFIGITSGGVEETLYRGYAIERLSAMCGSRALGAAAATIAFGLAHVPYWGVRFSLAADLPFGIMMTLLYLWRRDLAANALAHAAALVVGLLSLPGSAA